MHKKIVSFSSAFDRARASLSRSPPSAKEILESVRLQQAQQELDLQGQLREGEQSSFRFALPRPGRSSATRFRIRMKRCNCAWATTIRGSRK